MFKKLDPLKPYLYKYRAQFMWGGLALLLNNAIWIMFPQVIGRAINDLNRGFTRHKIVTYSLTLVAIALSKGFFQYLMRWILIGISREI
jgi:ATP-binding cassette subfamily B protein